MNAPKPTKDIREAKPTDDETIAFGAARWHGDGKVENDALNKALKNVHEPIADLARRRKDPIAAFVLGARLTRGEALPR